MKHRASVFAATICAACLALGLAGCSDQSQEYTPELKSATVSSPVIGEDGVLRVGVAGEESAPFTMTSSGEVVGLDVDMAAAIADQMGLKLEIVNVESDGDSALENGDVDILMGLMSSDGSSAWLSDPYIQTAIALFASSGETEVPTRDSAPKIAAQGSSTSAWAVSTVFGDDALVSAGDLMSAFSSVEEDQASYVAADAVIGTYAALYQNVDMEPIALLEQPSGYCIGVSSENTDLQQAIADALSAVTDGGIADVISSKWLGTALDLSSLSVVESSSGSTSSDDSSDGSETDSSGSSSSDAGSNAVIPDQAA